MPRKTAVALVTELGHLILRGAMANVAIVVAFSGSFRFEGLAANCSN